MAGKRSFSLAGWGNPGRKRLEKPPLGLILCSEKSQERIELMELAKSSIRVAEYLTVLPPRDLLAKKLHEAIRQAQARMLPEKVADAANHKAAGEGKVEGNQASKSTAKKGNEKKRSVKKSG